MRKKVMVVFRMLVLLAGVAAVLYGQDNASQFCKANDDFAVGHDTCVGCLNKGRGNDAVCLCKVIRDLGLLETFGFKNLGQCVSNIFRAQ